MLTFFRYLIHENTITIWLYNFILFFSVLFAFKSQRRLANKNFSFQTRFHPNWFIASFFVLWFFITLTDTGSDLGNYYSFYTNVDFTNISINSFSNAYYGYLFLNASLNLLFKDPVVGIGVIKTLSLFLVFLAFYLMRDKIDIGMAVLGFGSLYYFYSYSALKWSIAGSLCLLSSIFYYKSKRITAVFFAILGVFMHASCLIFLCGLLLGYMTNGLRQLRGLKVVVMLVAMVVTLLFGTRIIYYIIQNTEYLPGRYDDYLSSERNIGVMQIVYYIPIFLMIYSGHVHGTDRRLNAVAILLGLEGFVIAMLGYKIGQLGRLEFAFSLPLLIYVPYYLRAKHEGLLVYNYNRKPIMTLNYQTLRLIMITYFIFRYALSMSRYFYAIAINEYHLIWQ